MCANTYAVICSVSQTSCNHSGTPKREVSSATKAEGEEPPLPSPGLAQEEQSQGNG